MGAATMGIKEGVYLCVHTKVTVDPQLQSLSC